MATDRKALKEAWRNRKQVGGVYLIKNTVTGKGLLMSALDIGGSKNQFEFSQMTGSCVKLTIQRDWDKYGSRAFTFLVLETLEKKETQTDEEFRQDTETLLELWKEKLDPQTLY